jgi:hypothetical protein
MKNVGLRLQNDKCFNKEKRFNVQLMLRGSVIADEKMLIKYLWLNSSG